MYNITHTIYLKDNYTKAKAVFVMELSASTFGSLLTPN